MLSDVWKDKMAANQLRIIEIMKALPQTFKRDHEYIKLKAENAHYEAQIRRYNAMLNGNNNTKA
jgi:hypothetical protein